MRLLQTPSRILNGATLVAFSSSALLLLPASTFVLLTSSALILSSSSTFAAEAPPTPYALRTGSQSEVGCFGPCDCPSMIRGPVSGTFELAANGLGDTFQGYDVSVIRWTLADMNGGDVTITGEGQYQIGGSPATQHQMVLDLIVDGVPQHFDSGLVPGGADFPQVDISIAVHGFFCFDSVFVLSAAPQGASGILPDQPALELTARPNPFRDATRVWFDLPAEGEVELRIHDVAGRLVRTLSPGRRYGEGPQMLAWDGLTDNGLDAPAGVYFARLDAPQLHATLRVARVR